MILKFKEFGHKYESIATDSIKWTSATSLIHKYVEPFDADKAATSSSKNPKSKWYGMEPTAIQAKWKEINASSLTLGSAYHAKREAAMLSVDSIVREGKSVPIIKPIYEGEYKISRNQKLEDGIYPEHMVYLKSAGLCGQSDLVEVIDNVLFIKDYKTNRDLKFNGFMKFDPVTKQRYEEKMLAPFNHLPACNMSEYNLQLSLYMYMVLKHNPKLKPGTLTIEHIIFKSIGEDEFGYPIYEVGKDGAPVVENIIPYELPYLKDEVIALIESHKASLN